MAKAIQLITKGAAKQALAVTVGTGKTGNPFIIKAQADVKYELKDVATKFAPQQLSFIRKGKDLWIKIKDKEDPQNTTNYPDIIIENYYYYSPSNLIGLSEDGQYFNYTVPKGINELIAGDIHDVGFSYYSPGNLLGMASIIALISLIDVSKVAKPDSNAEEIGPIEIFGNMMAVMMDMLSNRMQSSNDPFVETANTIGSMMHSFMEVVAGITGGTFAQEFALALGEEMRRLISGLIEEDEDFAKNPEEIAESIMPWMSGETNLYSLMTIIGNVMEQSIEILLSQPDSIQSMAGFDTLLWNITQAATSMQTMSESIIQSGLQIIPNNLYTLSSDGTLINISELSQASTDGSQLNITELLNGNQLLIGYTIPENLLFTLEDISNITNIIQQGFSIE